MTACGNMESPASWIGGGVLKMIGTEEITFTDSENSTLPTPERKLNIET